MRLTKEQIMVIHFNCVDGQGFRSEPVDFELSRDATSEELEADFTNHTINIKEPVIYMIRTIGGYHSFGERGYFYGYKREGYVDQGWDSFVVLNEVLRILKPDLNYLQYEEVTKLIRKASNVESNSFIDYNEDGSFLNNDDESWWHTHIRFVIPSDLYDLLERLKMFEERSVIFDEKNSKSAHSLRPLAIQQDAAGYYGFGKKEYKPLITDKKFLLLLDNVDAGDNSLLDEILENYNFDSIQGSLLQQRRIFPNSVKYFFPSENAIIDASEPSIDNKGARSMERFVCLMIKDGQYSVQTGDNTRVLARENLPLGKEGLLAAIKLAQLEAKQHNMVYHINRVNIELEKYND
jgi:hypothetical protein